MAAYLKVMGSSDWLPTEGNDGASYLIGEHLMVDTGWGTPVRLLMEGKSLQQYTTLMFTHMHADHIMALPQVLLSWRIARGTLKDFTIAGPCETLRESYERASRFIYEGKLDAEVSEGARLLELAPRDSFETDEFVIEAMPSLHATPGRCYRVTDKATGHVLGLSGDTAYQSDYADFFRNCDLLIHECSFGTQLLTPEKNRICKHSSVTEAARVARECGAKKLMLTHSLANRAECVAKASSLVDIPVTWANPGEVFEF